MSIYKKACVTGAGGFIGRALCESLRDAGVEVTGVDFASGDPGVVAGDISRDGPWLEALNGCDLVIHTAAIVSMQGDPERFYAINIAGTRRVLDAAANAGAKRFVHLSTTGVYSDKFTPDADESHPVRINGNPYVDSKIAAEQVVLQAHAGGEIPVTVIRPGDVYGPGSRPWTIEPVAMLKKRQLVLPDGGNGIFSPIYLDDVVAGILAAAESPAGAGHVFNISCAAGVTNMEFFGHYARMTGTSIPTMPAALAVPLAAVGHKLRRVLPVSQEMNAQTVRFMLRTNTHSIVKARELLGWGPRVDLDEGMRRTEAWLREQGLI